MSFQAREKLDSHLRLPHFFRSASVSGVVDCVSRRRVRVHLHGHLVIRSKRDQIRPLEINTNTAGARSDHRKDPSDRHAAGDRHDRRRKQVLLRCCHKQQADACIIMIMHECVEAARAQVSARTAAIFGLARASVSAIFPFLQVNRFFKMESAKRGSVPFKYQVQRNGKERL